MSWLLHRVDDRLIHGQVVIAWGGRMRPRRIWVVDDASAADAWERMRAARIRHLVVKQGAEIVGVLSERDLGGRSGATVRRDRSVADLMTRSVLTARPKDTLRSAATRMRGASVGCLPVTEGRRLVGLVTVSDLLELVGRGAMKPVVRSKRWTLKHRGPGRK